MDLLETHAGFVYKKYTKKLLDRRAFNFLKLLLSRVLPDHRLRPWFLHFNPQEQCFYLVRWLFLSLPGVHLRILAGDIEYAWLRLEKKGLGKLSHDFRVFRPCNSVFV